MQYYSEHNIKVTLKRIGLPDTFIQHGSIASLKKTCGIDSNSLIHYLQEIIEKED
jgi:1-deoxy-D-xylulose-5-phosphate synthase